MSSWELLEFINSLFWCMNHDASELETDWTHAIKRRDKLYDTAGFGLHDVIITKSYARLYNLTIRSRGFCCQLSRKYSRRIIVDYICQFSEFSWGVWNRARVLYEFSFICWFLHNYFYERHDRTIHLPVWFRCIG